MEVLAIIVALFVPIGIAIWTVRSSAKDTAKTLAALEESTTNQIKSIKKLAKTQIELTRIQLDIKLWEANNKLEQKEQENKWAVDRESGMLGVPYNEYTQKQSEIREKEDKNLAEQTYYTKQKMILSVYKESLKAIELELNKD